MSFVIPVDTLKAQLTTQVLDGDSKPVVALPWINLAISAVVFALLGLFLSGRVRAGGGGVPKARRRFSGYEE